MRNKIFFAAFVILVILLIFYSKPEIMEIKIAEKILQAEIADNPISRSTGLMNRFSPSPMLFILQEPAEQSFWMKNVNFPLDIIWIDENKNVIGFENMETCKTEPCPTYKPSAPIKYALEVEAGFAEKNGIKIGDKLEIPNK